MYWQDIIRLMEEDLLYGLYMLVKAHNTSEILASFECFVKADQIPIIKYCS
jgi:hypothetical protein